MLPIEHWDWLTGAMIKNQNALAGPSLGSKISLLIELIDRHMAKGSLRYWCNC